MMKKRFATWPWQALLLLGFVAGLGNLQTAHAQISIVVAKSAKLDSNDLKKSEIKEIFTGNKQKWSNGNKIQVVDQAETAIGKEFYEKVLNKSLNQVRHYWTRLMLSGQASAPLQCPSDKIVKKVVAGSAHAIGYISTSSLDDSVKEILRIPQDERGSK